MALGSVRLTWKFFANWLLGLSAILVMLASLFGMIPYAQMGFRCNDPKLSYKFSGDSVSIPMIFGVTLLVPLLVLAATERSYNDCKSWRSGASITRERNFWRWYGNYLLGFLYSALSLELVKVSAGEPRPHFMESCRPREAINCTAGEHIPSYTCTNAELAAFYVLDSDKSFFSGHAAISMFTATFLILYVQVRLPRRLSPAMLKPSLHSLSLAWGIGCGVSRITDNRHHWWDVLFGGCFGLCWGLYIALVYCSGFRVVEEGGSADSSLDEDGATESYPRHKKRHSSIVKLLSNFYTPDLPDDKEMEDM